MKPIINLIPITRTNGFVRIENDEGEVEWKVEIDCSYQPYEKETLESPRVEAEVIIEKVHNSIFNFDIDLIENLEEAQYKILNMRCEPDED